MNLTLQARLVAVIPKEFTKGKGEQAEVVHYYENTFRTEEGVITLTSGKGYTSLEDKEVLVSLSLREVEVNDPVGKVFKVKVINVEEIA